jgi:hypothetical protein
VGVPVGQWPDQRCVHKGKDGHTGAYAEGKDEDTHSRKAWTLCEHSQAEADVLNEIFDVIYSSHFAARLFDRLDAAKPAESRETSLLRAHPRRNVLLNLLFQMKRHFIGKFLIEFLFPKQRAQSVEEFHSNLPLPFRQWNNLFL